MKKVIIYCLLAAAFFGCSLEDKSMNKDLKLSFKLWLERPKVTIGDGKITISWKNSLPYINLETPVVLPDKYEIYMAENEMSDFLKIAEIKYEDEYSHTINNLQNGKPFFIFTMAKKNGFEPATSDTLMVVPNKRKEFETLLIPDGAQIESLWNVSVAQQIHKIAYQEIYDEKYSDLVTVPAFRIGISNMDGSEREILNTDAQCFSPCWSPANDKIAFHIMGKNEQSPKTAQIALYDYEGKTVSRLTAGDESNFAPVFSKDGEFLLFQSARNIPDNDVKDSEPIPANIWLFNLKTGDSYQVTDLAKTSLVAAERPHWIDNDRFLFHGAYPGGKCQLFETSVSEKQIKKIIDSNWNDYIPSISPGQQKIAFLSDRSGRIQVWIYHLESKQYTQITGYSEEESVTPYYFNITWLDNSTIVYNEWGNQLIKQNI